ncbi:MAG: hypothetical protein GC178_08985 [Flavobacteriales bacterium]|nr:hypothetical protein [Flavobacteriales bacterium]
MGRITAIQLIIIILISACNQTSQQDKYETSDNSTTVDVTDALSTLATQDNSETKTVSEIALLIDSVYDINRSDLIDTITDWSIPNGLKHELGPRGLDLTDLQEFYRYSSFSFLLFRNKGAAQRQFDRIVESMKTRPDHHNGTEHLYWALFSKGGSAYILYDSMIIYHQRRCNYNENIEVPREERFIDYLFDSKRPAEGYFVRARCGWSANEIK